MVTVLEIAIVKGIATIIGMVTILGMLTVLGRMTGLGMVNILDVWRVHLIWPKEYYQISVSKIWHKQINKQTNTTIYIELLHP